MSTAGKVLSVLTVLMLVVWIALVSAVAQLNISAAAEVKKLRESAAQLREDAAKSEQNAVALLAAISAEQQSKERDQFVDRSRLSTAERQLSTTREALVRTQLQLEAQNRTLASARADLALRNAEKTAVEKAKADEEALVKRLQGENAQLIETLQGLRSDFQEALKQNAAAVDRLLKSSPQPTARPASFVR